MPWKGGALHEHDSPRFSRRDVLRAGLGAGLVTPSSQPTLQAVPRVNGGINVSPLRRFDENAGTLRPIIVPRLVELQLKLIYDLGFEQMRITIAFEEFGPNFLAAIPYVRAARALGIDVLGIVADFTGFGLVRALTSRTTRDEVLETYARIFGDFVPAASSGVERPGRFAVQVLNEPTHFTGIGPETYVREVLRPSYLHLKEDDPSLVIIAAAPVSSAEGFLRAQRMIEAGVEHVCDRVAFHVYSLRFLDRLSRLTEKPTWVTESGAFGTSRHLDWRTSSYDEIRRALPLAEQIYWFDLFDFERNGFRLFDIVPDPLLDFVAVKESTALVDWLEARVREAAAGAPRARFEDLIRDVTLYFPTEEDIRLIESTSFGLAEGL